MEELTSILNLQEEKSPEDLKSPTLKGGTVADMKVGLGKKDQKKLDDESKDEKTGKAAGGTSGAAESPRQDESLDLEESEQLDERETSAGQARTDDRHKSHGRGQDEGPGGSPLEEDEHADDKKKDKDKLRQSVKDKTFLGGLDDTDVGKGEDSDKLDKAFDKMKENMLTKEQFARAKATIKEALKNAMR